MILLFITFFALFHILGDIVLQTKQQEIDKHINFRHLLEHVLIYSVTMVIPLLLNDFLHIFSYQLNVGEHFKGITLFFSIMFISHLIIDYFFSKIIEKNSNNSKKFLISVQVDQLIHYLVLYSTLFFLYM